MTQILAQQMKHAYYPNDTDPMMDIDDRGFHDVDMLLAMQSEIEQEDYEEAGQNFAYQMLDSDMGGVSVPASASSGSASADSLGALAKPQWFTHATVDGVTPQQQMFNLADERGDEVYVGSDVIGGKKGQKKFVPSGKHAQLAAKVLKCFAEKSPCTLYEMIRENMPCKPFLDVEWEESKFSGYSRLNSVVDAACTKCVVSLLLFFILYFFSLGTQDAFSFVVHASKSVFVI
jgi:hypothetical protein